jgi:hypothetical protein
MTAARFGVHGVTGYTFLLLYQMNVFTDNTWDFEIAIVT